MQLEKGSSQQQEVAKALLEITLFVIRETSVLRDISLSAAATLSNLSSGPRRVTELAEQERSTQPTMTAMVVRLEQRGLVRRCNDPSDGRAVLVSITDLGLDLIKGRRRAQVAFLSSLIGELDPIEQNSLLQARQALEHVVNPDAVDTAVQLANQVIKKDQKL